MKKQKTYYVSRRNCMSLLALLIIFASAATLFLQHIRSGIFSQTIHADLLEGVAVLLLAAIVLFHGEEFFFRSAIPVWLWCLSEILLLLPLSSPRQKTGFLILYPCIAILYTALASGKLSKKSGIGGILACTALLAVIKGVAEASQMLPTLLMISGFVLLILSTACGEIGRTAEGSVP